MSLIQNEISPIQYTPIIDPVFEKQGIVLSLARLDLLPYPSGGNKTFKLKYNLIEAKNQGYDTLITFGGAFSNHLPATAESANYYKFKSIGIVRGEETFPLNETLAHCHTEGMQLYYISREDYRKKTDSEFLQQWMREQGIPSGYLIPEGGSNAFAVEGVAELMLSIPSDTDIITTASGTGGTLAGLIAGMNSNQEAWGYSALKGGDFFYDDIKKLLLESNHEKAILKSWKIVTNYHLGGYAKCPLELLDFIKHFYQTQGILLDPIYTGKMMYGLYEQARQGLLPVGKKIVALHSGGIQACNGMPEKKVYIST